MTLYEIIHHLIDCAAAQPNINTTLTDNIYQLNTMGDVEYTAVCVSFVRCSTTEDIDNYTLNIFYVDRLNENRNNQVDIQNMGVLVLRNIINRFNSIDDETQVDYEYQITPFYEKFTADCSGVFATINVTTPTIGLCELM